ncbi:hypothetical protein [Amycolatopsis sp. lyj-23]|uniref:hypothetical protein n=1 Tax=Amycolatopsis sp. lyj-23 TaxID=2789283 RepID=UPI00397876E4
MEPFFQPDRLWPAGHRQLPLLIIPDLGANSGFADCADFVTRCRSVMAGHPGTTEPVPDASLHLTVQPIGFPGRDRVEAATRTRLITALEYTPAEIPAFDLLMGSALVYHRGVVTDTHHRCRYDSTVLRRFPLATGPERGVPAGIGQVASA